ncbi:MAG: metal ABC transporter solute-binding protein, Zn/Mn family [Bacteroidota bacterium]
MNKALLFLSVLLMLTSGCVRSGTAESQKTQITVSILPEVYFVRQIAGDLADINVMIPPGASPATYEPTPQQLHELLKSTLYMKIGYSAFESSWMEKMTAVNPSMLVTDLSRNIELIREEHSHEGEQLSVNPHTWLSPANARIIARNVAADLKRILPGDSAVFNANLSAFLLKTDTLDRQLHEILDPLENRAFMIYHPALTYFARDYNLEQYALETDGKEPSPAHMKYLTDLAREKGIKVIFLQMQFDQHNAMALSKETGAEIVQINPLDPEWYNQMLFIAETMKEKLR